MTDLNDLYDAGLQVRREVLGQDVVGKALAQQTPFTEDMQRLVTEYCWGRIWTRGGLSREQRSLINLGIMTALNRQHEFKLHVRGAVNNGCTTEQIKEVILQAAIYCGVPAAMQSFRDAEAVLSETKEESNSE